MRLFFTVLFYIASAVLVWVADAAIMAFYSQGHTVYEQIFSNVPLVRLIIRGVLSLLLLFIGYLKIRRLIPGNAPYNMFVGNLEENLLNGSAESHKRSQRVLYHGLGLAKHYKLTEREIEGLRILCYCYDMGMVSVPSAVLNKKEQLTPGEREELNAHTRYGAEIVASIKDLAVGAEYVLYHEEYFNGGGVYGLQGRKIPLACRIFQVVWMYDCMVYNSDSHKSLVCDDALLELRYYAGTALDPDVVEVFINMMNKNRFSFEGLKAFSLR